MGWGALTMIYQKLRSATVKLCRDDPGISGSWKCIFLSSFFLSFFLSDNREERITHEEAQLDRRLGHEEERVPGSRYCYSVPREM